MAVVVIFNLWLLLQSSRCVQSFPVLQIDSSSTETPPATESSEATELPTRGSQETTWNFGVFNPRFHVEAEEISDQEWHQMMVDDLKRHQVIDQVIDQVPAHVININYRDHACVHLGNQLTPAETKLAPLQVSYPTNGSSALYTLVAINPDVPSRSDKRYSEYLQWLIVNIPDDKVDQGESLVDYQGPLPSDGAGLHRFIFLLYRQTHRVDVLQFPHASPCDFLLRARFDCRKFAQLQNLGQPVAINYFVTEYDDTVPQVINSCLE